MRVRVSATFYYRLGQRLGLGLGWGWECGGGCWSSERRGMCCSDKFNLI